MLQTLKKHLLRCLPELEGRCLDPTEVTSETLVPFITIELAVSLDRSPWTGFRRMMEIGIHINQEIGAEALDEWIAKVDSILRNQLYTSEKGIAFCCFGLEAAGSDRLDWELQRRSRIMRFPMMVLQPLAILDLTNNDPWVTALADWTRTALGLDWQIHLNHWPANLTLPAVLWRLDQTEIIRRTRYRSEVRKYFQGAVAHRSFDFQATAVQNLAELLDKAYQLPLDAELTRFAKVAEVAAYPRLEPGTPQLKLVLSRTEDHRSGVIPAA